MIYSILTALVLATHADAAALRSTSPLLGSNSESSTEALIVQILNKSAKFSTKPALDLTNIGAPKNNTDTNSSSCSHSKGCNQCVYENDPDYCPVSGVGWDRSCERFCAENYCKEKCTVSTTETSNFLTSVQHDGPTAKGNQPTTGVADPCERKVHYNDNIWISMAAWNDVTNLHRAIRSIQSQIFSFKNVHLVVYEDPSDEMLRKEEKIGMYPNVIFLEPENNEQKGAAYAKWRLFEYIRNHADLDDYVMIVDGDDQLADDLVLSEVRQSLMKHKPWFAWGKINGKNSDQCGPMLHPMSLLRHVKWFVCHPRIFKAHLLHRLKAKDFQRDDGTWLQKATDRPFIYTFMEEAGPNRILFLDKRGIYNYTYNHNNGLKRFKKGVITGDKVLVNSRPSKQKSPDIVHVIACMWQRSATDTGFLTSLMNSYFIDRKTLNIHICNNSPAYQARREKIAQDLNDNNHGHKITIHDMGSNTYGYGRFLLAKQLQKVQPIDYIIMVDDDQRVIRDTLSDIYNVREPLTFKAWYGKSWNADNKDYWHPNKSILDQDVPSESIKQHPEITSWQYGGSGMSIVDANAFRIEELFQIPEVYKDVEDMWLSYVLQLAGYKIGRLFTIFDVIVSESNSGQWTQLKKKKNRLFEVLGYLKCGIVEN